MLFDVGDRVRCSVVFATDDVPPVYTDPTVVTFAVHPPGTGDVTYTYGVGIVIVKDSTGHYHADFDIATAGRWWLRWDGTGALTAADVLNFLVTA